MGDDPFGVGFDLAQTLEKTQRCRVILDLDAEQRGNRGAQQLRQFLQGFDLDDLALFQTIDRGAGDTQLVRDVFRLQGGADTVGAQPCAQLFVVNGRGRIAQHGFPFRVMKVRKWPD